MQSSKASMVFFTLPFTGILAGLILNLFLTLISAEVVSVYTIFIFCSALIGLADGILSIEMAMKIKPPHWITRFFFGALKGFIWGLIIHTSYAVKFEFFGFGIVILGFVQGIVYGGPRFAAEMLENNFYFFDFFWPKK